MKELYQRVDPGTEWVTSAAPRRAARRALIGQEMGDWVVIGGDEQVDVPIGQ